MLVNSLGCESPLYFFINNHHQWITHQFSIIPCFPVKLNSIVSIMLGIRLLAIPPTTISDVAGQLSCWAAWAQQLVRPKKNPLKIRTLDLEREREREVGNKPPPLSVTTINTGDHHHLKCPLHLWWPPSKPGMKEVVAEGGGVALKVVAVVEFWFWVGFVTFLLSM